MYRASTLNGFFRLQDYGTLALLRVHDTLCIDIAQGILSKYVANYSYLVSACECWFSMVHNLLAATLSEQSWLVIIACNHCPHWAVLPGFNVTCVDHAFSTFFQILYRWIYQLTDTVAEFWYLVLHGAFVYSWLQKVFSVKVPNSCYTTVVLAYLLN